MKKESLWGGVVFTFEMVFIVLFGLLVLRERETSHFNGMGLTILFVALAAVVGLVLNVVLFELAHMLGAKLGRYQVLSVNLFGLCFYRNEEHKLKVKHEKYNGVFSETKILPEKDAKKPSNPTPFLTLGSLFFLVEAVVFVTVYALLVNKENKINNDIAYFLITVLFVGFLILFAQIFPLKLSYPNDGYRLTLVSNPKNKVAFNELLRVEHEIEMGNPNVEIMTFDQITNFTADLNLNKVYVLLNQEKYEEAEQLIKQIIDAKKGISYSVYINAVAQRIFIKFMTLPSEEVAKAISEFASAEDIRDISKELSMVCNRAYILLAGLIDKSKSEVVLTINNVKAAFAKTPKARQDVEVVLFNKALEKISEKHPEWNLEQYRLVEKGELKENNKADKKTTAEEKVEEPTEEVKVAEKVKETSEEKKDK